MRHTERGHLLSLNPRENRQQKHLWSSLLTQCPVWFGVGGSSVPEPSTFLTGCPGLFFSIGELWRTTRRFTVCSMRNLGMGKQMIEGRIFEELHFLIEMIKSFKGELGMTPGLPRLVCVTAAPPLTAFPILLLPQGNLSACPPSTALPSTSPSSCSLGTGLTTRTQRFSLS